MEPNESRMCVPKEIKLARVVEMAKRDLKVLPSESVFLYAENAKGEPRVLLTSDTQIGAVAQKHKNADGFTYVYLGKQLALG